MLVMVRAPESKAYTCKRANKNTLGLIISAIAGLSGDAILRCRSLFLFFCWGGSETRA